MTYIEPGLRRLAPAKESFMESWTAIGLLIVLFLGALAIDIYFTQVREILPTAHAAEFESTDRATYEAWDGYTQNLCKTYLQNHG